MDEINKVMNTENGAIDWLKQTAEDNKHPLHFVWNILEQYYNICLEELKFAKDLKFNDGGAGSKGTIYDKVPDLINKNDLFRDECCRFFECTQEELMKIINSKDENQKKYDTYIKIYRLYNMRLKLGHSARITYLANMELNDMLEGLNKDEYRLLTNTVLSSALLHDIGRFYQAVRFNTLSDYEMNLSKEEIFKDLRVDHAVAGYYYSLAEALQLHINSDNAMDFQEKTKYIEEVISSVVVRYHQEPNSLMEQFDYAGDIKEINDHNNKFIEQLFSFIMYANNISKNIIGLPVRFDEEHKNFIDNFLTEIFKKKNLDSRMTAGFKKDPDMIELENNNIKEIEELLRKIKLTSLEELSEKIIQIVNNNLKKYQKKKNIENKSYELNEREKEIFKRMIKENLGDMLNYDIATAINETMKNNKDINNLIRVFISKCYSITTDADKIDIFNQRALDIYNTGTTMKTYEVFPEENLSLEEILSKHFNFTIKNNPLEIDQKLINILNKLNGKILKRLKESIFVNQDIFYKNDQGKYQIKSDFNKNEETLKGFKYLLKENYLEVLGNIGIIPKTIDNYKEFKNKYFNNLFIQIPTYILMDNIKDLKQEEQKEFLKNLVLTPQMIERFKKEDIQGMQRGWESTTDDSAHVASNSIAGLLIQINQFIFVNMRNLASFEYIRDNEILEKILSQYDKDSPEYYMLQDNIKYAVSFINKVIKYCKSNNKKSISKEELSTLRNGSNENELTQMFESQSEVNNSKNQIR